MGYEIDNLRIEIESKSRIIESLKMRILQYPIMKQQLKARIKKAVGSLPRVSSFVSHE